MSAGEVSGQEGKEPKAPIMGPAKSRGLRVVLAVLSLIGVLLAVWAINVLRRPSASALFRWYVMDPIPASVAHIKVDQPKAHGGFGYVFRFAVSQSDIEHIRKSRSLRKTLTRISYDDVLDLSWVFKDDPSLEYGLKPYRPGQRRPAWFDLATWKDPEAYALVEVDWSENKDKQILVYDSDLKQAFFMVFDYRGTMNFDFSLGGKYRGGLYKWNEDKPLHKEETAEKLPQNSIKRQ